MAWVAGVVAAVIVLAGGYFGYRMFGGEGAKQKLAATEPANAEAPPAVPASEAPKDSTATGPGGPGASTAGTTSPGTTTESPKVESAAPVGSSASSKEAMTESGAPSKTTVAKAPKAATAPAAGTPGAAAPATAPLGPGKAPTKAPTNVAQTAAAVQPDRWQMFADDIARCRKEDFLQRFVCEQRSRARYCDGYWGKVPQCPSAPPTDHGQ
ncbi:MAG TPA: hypothetical protein VMM27_05985 [Casimicrobiaceae bacterium]|nr:hypothetical protein [Casimicrobiaceae bacterium]